jgi:hypothetical protein
MVKTKEFTISISQETGKKFATERFIMRSIFCGLSEDGDFSERVLPRKSRQKK